MSGSCRKLVIALPMETSAPTYRKIATAPNTAQGDFSAVATDGRWPSSTGFVTSSRLAEHEDEQREQHERAGDRQEHGVDLAERLGAQLGSDRRAVRDREDAAREDDAATPAAARATCRTS